MYFSYADINCCAWEILVHSVNVLLQFIFFFHGIETAHGDRTFLIFGGYHHISAVEWRRPCIIIAIKANIDLWKVFSDFIIKNYWNLKIGALWELEDDSISMHFITIKGTITESIMSQDPLVCCIYAPACPRVSCF